MRGPSTHAFHPNPQPPTLPEKAPFQHGAVAKIGGQWLADVYDGEKKGRGQAVTWTAAMNAAIEDLQEKKS